MKGFELIKNHKVLKLGKKFRLEALINQKMSPSPEDRFYRGQRLQK